MSSPVSRALTALVLLSALAASATVIAWESLDTMARRVPVIVRGHVTRSVSEWDADKRRIWTWTELTVTESIKGKTGSTVFFKQPGGEVRGVGQRVEGVARFREGEDCVVLLAPAPDEPGTLRVYGMSAGKILFTTWLGQPAAVRTMDGLAFAKPGGARVEKVDVPEFLGAPDAFLAHLREVAGGTK